MKLNLYLEAADAIKHDPLGWFDTRDTADAVAISLAIAGLLQQTGRWVEHRFAMPADFLAAAQHLAQLTLHEQPLPLQRGLTE